MFDWIWGNTATVIQRPSLPTELEKNPLFIKRKVANLSYDRWKCKAHLHKLLCQIEWTFTLQKRIDLAQRLFDCFLMDEYRFYVRDDLTLARTIYNKSIELNNQYQELKLELPMRALFPSMPCWNDCLAGAAFQPDFVQIPTKKR
jgi:hypothetical protein